MKKTSDLTQGKPLKTLFTFMTPILVGNVFQQLYSMVDAIIVGQTISPLALGGIGATGSISFLIISFTMGLTAGFSVHTAQRFGAKDFEGVRRSIAHGIILAFVFALFLTILSVYLARPMLQVMKTSVDLVDYAYDYVIVIFAGMIATMFYNLFSNILRAIGDSVTPLVFLIVASILNIGLDFLFILKFNMGVAGAGYATVISQVVAASCCIVYTFIRYPMFRICSKHFLLDSKTFHSELTLGIPMALQFSLISIGLLFVQVAINSLGNDHVIAFTAAVKIDTLAAQFMLSVGLSLAVFTGQNFGAKRFDRIQAGIRSGVFLSVIGAIIFGTLVITLSKPLTMLFVGDSYERIYELSGIYLKVNGSFYFVLGLLGVFRNVLQGISRSMLVLVAGGIELLSRTVFSFISLEYFGYTGICFCAVITWVLTTIYLIITYFFVAPKAKLQCVNSSTTESANGKNLDPYIAQTSSKNSKSMDKLLIIR
ncbi:MAG: MATE family efflux transporter [Christensenellaceae bacterium]|jgi:putative MATE family efflux protein|nr:MATE family efflux transporter [Christensenellaceae bacterium]